MPLIPLNLSVSFAPFDGDSLREMIYKEIGLSTKHIITKDSTKRVKLARRASAALPYFFLSAHIENEALSIVFPTPVNCNASTTSVPEQANHELKRGNYVLYM